MKKIILLISLIVLSIPSWGQAYNLPNNNFPRTVNLYWKTPITMAEAPILAKWDILVLDMKAQVDSAQVIRKIRTLNPDIIILAYTTANEIPAERLKIMEPSGTGLWHDLIAGINEDWYLKTYTGEKISYWPGNFSMNQFVSDDFGNYYNDYLVNFYANEVLETGLWDGLLFDNIWNNAAWINPHMDIDGDGQFDSEAKINELWQISNRNFFKNLRHKLGDQYLILGNGEGSYSEFTNGRMFESFPEFWEGGWTGSMARYFEVNTRGYQPRLNIINADSDNTGQYTNSRRMRYGLASTLMYNGYYSFDFGTEKREDFWWYDEFAVNLGQPKSTPINLLDQKNGQLINSVWQREFENGLALVNSTDQIQTINFESEYEKVTSAQNNQVHHGGKINSLTLNPEDGTILLRPIDTITGAVYTNGSFARVFNQNGENIRSSFFTYNSQFRGGQKIIQIDLDSDGRDETIVTDKTTLKIFSADNLLQKEIIPYGHKFTGGISIAVADLNHDSQLEIITGPENGASNEVKIFNYDGLLINSWYAYKKEWLNLGVNVATGDVNGDGEIEIIIGAGYRGGPHVRIFDQTGHPTLGEFFAYDPLFKSGTYVASGDVNGDGIDEIITSLGPTGQPHLKVFDFTGTMSNEWIPDQSKIGNGVRITVSDIDHDGISEIIALTNDVFTLSSLLVK